MKSLFSNTSESLGARLSLPVHWRQRLRPLTTEWLSKADFSLTSLRIKRAHVDVNSDRESLDTDGTTPP